MGMLIVEKEQQRQKERPCLPRSASESNYLKCQRQDLPFQSQFMSNFAMHLFLNPQKLKIIFK